MSTVKLLALFNGAYPGGMAMSQRLHYYAKALENRPSAMHVASVQSAVTEGSFENITFMGINPVRGPVSAIRHRWNHYFNNDFKSILFFYKRKQDYKIFWLIGFGFWTTLILSSIARFYNKKVVLEVNEKPYTVGGSTFSQIQFLNCFWRWMTFTLIYPRINGFVVISGMLEMLVQEHKASTAKVLCIPILNRPKDYQYHPRANEVPFLFHAGALSEKKDGITTVIKAFARAGKVLTPRRLKFVLTSKVALPSLQRTIKEIGDEYMITDQIIFTGHLTTEELEAYMRSATLAVVHKPDNEQNRYNFPTKLGDYLSYGIPIIASKGGEMAKYLVDGQNCFLVDPGDEEGIAAKIVFILNNPDEARRIGLAGRRLVDDEFNYANFGKQLDEFFKSIEDS